VWVPRQGDSEPANGAAQFGLAFRGLFESLNNAELGLYYVRYHNHVPSLSAIRGTSTNLGNESTGGGSSRYFREYVGGINLFEIGRAHV
jgi:hypothetical protein